MAAVLACAAGGREPSRRPGGSGGCCGSRPGTIHVTVPTPRDGEAPFVVHFADLPARGLGRLEDGIPVTAPRSDHARPRGGAFPRCGSSASSSAPKSWALRPWRVEDAARARSAGHPGIAARLRAALAIYRDRRSGLRRAPSSSGAFSELVQRAGLPTPAMNFNVLGLRARRLLGAGARSRSNSTSSRRTARARAFERDRLRQEDLKLNGVEMIRVTGPRLDREPEAIVARVEPRRCELAPASQLSRRPAASRA